VAELNANDAVDGILVQLPLPKQIDELAVVSAVDPGKDVDGLHVVSAGRLVAGLPGMTSCTPLGCLMLLKDQLGDLSGLDATVIGRSILVGKPMGQLLLGANCTVTIAHSRTRNLADKVRQATSWSPHPAFKAVDMTRAMEASKANELQLKKAAAHWLDVK
jgi:methylenetetrahydrofolate dehydrogenase (NADP+) / methenyltetrahydrofolate cyclohydrolase